MKFTSQKLEAWATVWWKFHNPNFSRFRPIHPWDRQTDGQTDGWAIAYGAIRIYAICCRARKTNSGHGNSFLGSVYRTHRFVALWMFLQLLNLEVYRVVTGVYAAIKCKNIVI